jgi:hypothetical protein
LNPRPAFFSWGEPCGKKFVDGGAASAIMSFLGYAEVKKRKRLRGRARILCFNFILNFICQLAFPELFTVGEKNSQHSGLISIILFSDDVWFF